MERKSAYGLNISKSIIVSQESQMQTYRDYKSSVFECVKKMHPFCPSIQIAVLRQERNENNPNRTPGC